ncbi:MAG: hypothetical protein OIF50_07710 [Flavobacteriaceae bacterium]|nr:hypothetical protein [Flavobacteriaceae bacterium]
MESIKSKKITNTLEKFRMLSIKLSAMPEFLKKHKEFDLDAFNAQTDALDALHQSTEKTILDKKKKVNSRYLLYRKEPNSLLRRLPNLRSYIEGYSEEMGYEGQQLMALISRMQGTKKASSSKQGVVEIPNLPNAENTDKKRPSKHELTYANRYFDLQNILRILTDYGPSYNPANENIGLKSLIKLSETIRKANQAVYKSKALVSKKRKERKRELNKQMKETKRIFKLVASQFNKDSKELKSLQAINF